MIDMTSGSEHDLYIYTVDDERVWSYDLVRNVSHWTIRDLGGKVLRDYVNNNGTWGLQSDYLYRDGLLLASETRTGQYHYHLDHLGTPRLITTISGTQAAYHAYYPFGEEATAFNQGHRAHEVHRPRAGSREPQMGLGMILTTCMPGMRAR